MSDTSIISRAGSLLICECDRKTAALGALLSPPTLGRSRPDIYPSTSSLGMTIPRRLSCCNPPAHPPTHIAKKANIKSPIRSTLCRSLDSLINSWITRILLSWRWVWLFIKMSSDLYRERLTKDYALISEMNSFNAPPARSRVAPFCVSTTVMRYIENCSLVRWGEPISEPIKSLRDWGEVRPGGMQTLNVLTFDFCFVEMRVLFFYDSILKHFYEISVGVKADCVRHQTFRENFTSWLGSCPHVHRYF